MTPSTATSASPRRLSTRRVRALTTIGQTWRETSTRIVWTVLQVHRADRFSVELSWGETRWFVSFEQLARDFVFEGGE